MAGAVKVQAAREELLELRSLDSSVQDDIVCQQVAPADSQSSSSPCAVAEDALDELSTPVDADEPPPCLTGPTALPQDLGAAASIVDESPCHASRGQRHSRLAPYKPGKMTVVLDMDECLLHSKFHGPGAASEAYRQTEERPEAVNEVNSFWVALDDGDTAQVNKRPGLDPFLEALARDYNTIVFTAAMPDYAGPVLDRIDPKGTLFHRRLYRSSCRQVKGAFLKDLSVLGVESTDMSRTVLVDNNPLSFICQPTNGVLVASFYDDPNDTALASVMQLIRHLDQAGDVRPILKDMFRLDTLLGEYRNALFDEDGDEDEEDILAAEEAELEERTLEDGEGGEISDDDDLLLCEVEREVQERSVEGEELPVCLLEDRGVVEDVVKCGKVGRRHGRGSGVDEDNESVKTEETECSDESEESSLGESLTSSEEMEMDLEF